MTIFIAAVFLLLAIFAWRRERWAYLCFVVLGLLYLPARAGFHVDPQRCELALDLPLALHSLTNYAHMALFALFYLLTDAQLGKRSPAARFLIAMAAVLAMGAAIELLEALTAHGHCRVRDLVPDAVGGLAGALLGALVARLRR
jgi:hypothetical protein